MKIRHGVIISIVLFIVSFIILGGEYLPIDYQLQDMLVSITAVLWICSLGLIVYLILRNIFRAIRGAAIGGRSRDYAAEARRACEAVTPKKDKNAAPPWEE